MMMAGTHRYQCRNEASVEIDGKPFCFIHDNRAEDARLELHLTRQWFEKRAVELVTRLADEGHEEAKRLVGKYTEVVDRLSPLIGKPRESSSNVKEGSND